MRTTIVAPALIAAVLHVTPVLASAVAQPPLAGVASPSSVALQPSPRPTLQVGPFHSPDASVVPLTMRLVYGVDSLVRRDTVFTVVATSFGGQPRSLEPLEAVAADFGLRAEVVRIRPDTLHVRWLLTQGRDRIIMSGREVGPAGDLQELVSRIASTVMRSFAKR